MVLFCWILPVIFFQVVYFTDGTELFEHVLKSPNILMSNFMPLIFEVCAIVDSLITLLVFRPYRRNVKKMADSVLVLIRAKKQNKAENQAKCQTMMTTNIDKDKVFVKRNVQ
jgi:hypothetical protein